MKVYDYDDMLKEELKSPAFRKEYLALEEEFEVAKKLIELRLKAGLTQQQLAVKAKTSQPCIARIESGAYRNVNLSFLRKIGNVFGFEPHVIFRERKVPHARPPAQYIRGKSQRNRLKVS